MATPAEQLLRRARDAQRESKYVDFKARFDPRDDGEWIEIVKDLVAMSNSGGGVVVIGVNNGGTPSGADVTDVLNIDNAKIVDKFVRYTGENFDDFELHSVTRSGTDAAAIVVGAVTGAPLVFTQAGKYTTAGGKSKTAFARGAIYVRHGAKSEPATRSDLTTFIDQCLEQTRARLLSGIRQVVEAPSDSEIVGIERVTDDTGQQRIRVTTDPSAPVFGQINTDDTYPHRQTELVQQVNKRLPRKIAINRYDVDAVRRVHKINDKTAPQFAHQPKFGSMQYSDAFVDWLVNA